MEQERKFKLFSRLFGVPNKWKNVLYLHVPFCLQRCTFCVYFSTVPKNRQEVLGFVEGNLVSGLQRYEALLSQTSVDEVYFGGGTPTMVPPDTLNDLYERIPGFRSVPLKATEASPKTIKEEHVALFSSWGFQYVSIGVQTFDVPTLRQNNRELADPAVLARTVEQLERAGIITNLDLIFFLGSVGPNALVQSREDLRRAMAELRPSSITVHSHYGVTKSIERRLGMIRVIREELARSPEWSCTNSLLREEDAELDMNAGVEYRLMRRSHAFDFYLIGKVPAAMRYGYNILALGDYDLFKLRNNYYYVSDFYSSYVAADVLAAARMREVELSDTRRQLGIAHPEPPAVSDFFVSAEGHERFAQIALEEGLPLLGQAPTMTTAVHTSGAPVS